MLKRFYSEIVSFIVFLFSYFLNLNFEYGELGFIVFRSIPITGNNRK